MCIQIVEPSPPRRAAASIEILENTDRCHGYGNLTVTISKALISFPYAINAPIVRGMTGPRGCSGCGARTVVSQVRDEPALDMQGIACLYFRQVITCL